MKRIAFYGGSFDPPHRGHLTIARKLTEQFKLDEFVFIPAFHAPHKVKNPTSAFHRYAMLCLATNSESQISVSKMELELPEKPYTVETLTRLNEEIGAETEIFFVMGADSWAEITTWREWEKVLTMTNIIVVTRPDYEIKFEQVTEEIRSRIIDLRKVKEAKNRTDEQTENSEIKTSKFGIYLTDAVQIDVSATEIRQKIKEKAADWQTDLPEAVAKYVEKYELYK